MTVQNLFRGQVIGFDVETIASDCLITLDIEDYNRLPPIINVGAPNGDTGLTQADGTVIWVDPRAGQTGIANAFGNYWPALSPTLDVVTGFLSDEVPGIPLIDQQTALTDLKAFVDSQAPRISGAVRWWIAPASTGDELVLWAVDFSDPAQVALLPAPYEIDNDAPNWTTRIRSSGLKVKWDMAGKRGSVYVRGGTPAPEGSGWATGLGSAPTGDAYVDAPGSITDDDKAEIGAWHQNKTLVKLMTGTATMPSSKAGVTYFGWALGQTLLITSSVHSRLVGHELDETPAVIQSVKGRLITPGNALAIKIDGTTLTKGFEWRSLTFESIMGSPGKATVVIHLLDAADTLTIGDNADALITVDDTKPFDIEWDLQFGDIPLRSLMRDFREIKPPPPPVVYRFNVEERDVDGVKLGIAEEVSAQIATGPASPVALAGVPMDWVVIQWEDAAGTVAGDMLELTDDTGTTDSAGRVFNTLTPSGVLPAGYNWEVFALALPIV